MEDIAAAIDALSSYDLEETKSALRYLAHKGEERALEYILPLTAHPDVAIRYFAKKAVRMLRGEPTAAPAGNRTVPSRLDVPSSEDVETMTTGSGSARKRPEYFRMSIVI